MEGYQWPAPLCAKAEKEEGGGVCVCVCVCVWLKFEPAFSTCLSSSAKRVRLQRQECVYPDQHKTRSSLAINAFVCSVISYSEVSSRGYLVASNKCVCMQCDIVLGGEQACQPLKFKILETIGCGHGCGHRAWSVTIVQVQLTQMATFSSIPLKN